MQLTTEEDARAFVSARCDVSSFQRLELLVQALWQENQSQNLVAETSLPNVWVRHIADSAQLLDHVSRETSIWLDLGTGAGFPGLVIAAMKPDWDVRLIESRALRIQWLSDMIVRLRLPNCQVIGKNISAVESFAAATISARAFAPLSRLIELAGRFSTNQTEWVLPKGRSAAQDIAELPVALQTRFHVKQSCTDADAGIVVAQGKMDGVQ